MEVFSDDTCVPGASGSGDETRYEIGKDTRENDSTPLLETAEGEHVADFPEFTGDRQSAGNHVEKDVPLSTQQHQKDGSDADATPEVDQGQQQHRKQGSGWNGSGDLRQGLRQAGQAGIESDGDAGGNCPRGRYQQGYIDAQK